MARVVEPLRAMGAHIDGRDERRSARRCRSGADRCAGMRHELAVASAQVKSALILAGLQADGTTEVVSPAPSRDHTERMLGALGAPLEVDGLVGARARAARRNRSSSTCRATRRRPRSSRSRPRSHPAPTSCSKTVSCNPTRVGFVAVLERMGADIEWCRPATRCGEPVGDIVVRARSVARHDDRRRRDPERDRRDSRARDRGRVRRRRHRDPRRGRAGGEGEQPHRHHAPGARAARRRRRGAARRSGRSVAATRKPGCSRATAIIGSRWRSRSPPTRSTARVDRARVARGRRPRIRSSRPISRSSRERHERCLTTPTPMRAVGRRDRRAVGLGEVDGGPPGRGRARPPRARHRCDVPRRHARRARAGRAARRRKPRSRRSRVAAIVEIDEDVTTPRRPRRQRRDPRPECDRRGVDRVGASRGAAGPRRPPAAVGRRPRWRRGRGARHRHRRVPRRGREGVPHRAATTSAPAAASATRPTPTGRSRSTTCRPRSPGATRSTRAGLRRRCARPRTRS